MEKNNHWLEPLKKFARTSDLSKAFLALDLDGTALLEDHGKVFISSSVEEGVRQLVKAGIDDLLLFFYSRDWKEGETLWTPRAKKIAELQRKYVSASRVISGSIDRLAEELSRREICMTSLFINRPEDTLMAYQHGKRNSFFTAKGVNKASGLRTVAAKLNLAPAEALGAGDTEM